MKFEWFIAIRYLFAKKRHSTINLITWVSMGGVAVGSMALICVMSVLNGFERVVENSFSNFDPDLKIYPTEGTSIDATDSLITIAKQATKGVAQWCEVIEQDGIISSSCLYSADSEEGRQIPVKVKGVGEKFGFVTNFDEMLWSGSADFQNGVNDVPVGVMGIGLAQKLGVSVEYSNQTILYVPKNRRVNLARPDANFTSMQFTCAGIFNSNQVEYDDNYIIMPIDITREAYQFDENYVNCYELKVEGDVGRIEKELEEILGEGYSVRNRHEQQEEFYKMSKIEKLSTFMILCFIMLIATFNIVGSLTMILIEKKEDIGLFGNIGATREQVRKIFRLQGMMISGIGMMIGIIIGIIIVLVQQWFGLLQMGTGFITMAYPVELRGLDVLIVMAVVGLMGWGASMIATKRS